jgi:hypothetical protein
VNAVAGARFLDNVTKLQQIDAFAGHWNTVLIGHHQHFGDLSGELSTDINTLTRETSATERAAFRI